MSIELDEWEVTFYTKRGLELERDSGIRALNQVVAERIAWQNFDQRHVLEPQYSRLNFNISIRRTSK